MNIDIYKALGNGPITMTCPGLDGAKAAQGQTNDAIRKLNALGLDELQEVDLELINRVESKLGAANTAMDGAMGHMQHLADNALWLSSKSNMVATLDKMAGLPVSSCVNTEKVFGPIAGASDKLFAAGSEVASNISQKVDDYLSGSLDLPEFESFLSDVGGLIDDATAKFDAMVAEGKAIIAEFEKKIMDSSFANAIDAVWNNPCTQAIMQSTLPDDIKQHLPTK
ncbi:hypothetical protein RJD38_21190 [Vibrio scophthalmi]|uniref:DUF7217 family protein n=1 Tax=Vibrio scophthalmi TaxID=45658 RepID=UPI00349FCCDF